MMTRTEIRNTKAERARLGGYLLHVVHSRQYCTLQSAVAPEQPSSNDVVSFRTSINICAYCRTSALKTAPPSQTVHKLRTSYTFRH